MCKYWIKDYFKWLKTTFVLYWWPDFHDLMRHGIKNSKLRYSIHCSFGTTEGHRFKGRCFERHWTLFCRGCDKHWVDVFLDMGGILGSGVFCFFWFIFTFMSFGFLLNSTCQSIYSLLMIGLHPCFGSAMICSYIFSDYPHSRSRYNAVSMCNAVSKHAVSMMLQACC